MQISSADSTGFNLPETDSMSRCAKAWLRLGLAGHVRLSNHSPRRRRNLLQEITAGNGRPLELKVCCQLFWQRGVVRDNAFDAIQNWVETAKVNRFSLRFDNVFSEIGLAVLCWL